MDHNDLSELEDIYKSWSKTFTGHPDQLLWRRFEKKGIVTIGTIYEASQVLAGLFSNKSPTTLCEFTINKADSGYSLEMIALIDEGYVDACVSSIPCSVFHLALERHGLEYCEVFQAQAMGFIWRADKKPIMEVFDVVQELEDRN